MGQKIKRFSRAEDQRRAAWRSSAWDHDTPRFFPYSMAFRPDIITSVASGDLPHQVRKGDSHFNRYTVLGLGSLVDCTYTGYAPDISIFQGFVKLQSRFSSITTCQQPIRRSLARRAEDLAPSASAAQRLRTEKVHQRPRCRVSRATTSQPDAGHDIHL